MTGSGSAGRWKRGAVALTAALTAALGVGWLIVAAPQAPSARRAWAPDHARLARADFVNDSLVTVRDVRDFAYTSATSFTPRHRSHTYDLSQLESAWFILTPFSTSWRGPAHAFVSFGFSDGEFLAISVEARREAREEYGLLAGMLRRFELAYVIGTERDLVGRRALFDGDDVHVYPVNSSRDRTRQMFVEMLRRANAVQDTPEFYNTLTNNCTSNIVDHVNTLIPGRVPWSLRTIMPGYADDLALSLGLIEAGGTIEEVRQRYRINDRARRAGLGDDFSQAIRGQQPF
ncbi:MAG: DUF4105 domain-containing protein [Gemmatimonadetes bacterium]|nr:DUF4105 domain-containing protein [Gemmatimonadota bacterium]